MSFLDEMKKDIENYAPKSVNREYVTLKTTTPLTDGIIKAHPKWSYLNNYYQAVNENPKTRKFFKIFITFLNCVFTQERVYFTMGRESFKDILKEDDNWDEKDKDGYSNGAWSQFISYVEDKNIVKCLNRGKGEALLYELIESELLSHIVIDKDTQRMESYEYINDLNDKESGHTHGTQVGTQVEDQDKISSKVSKVSKEHVPSEHTNQTLSKKMPFDTFLRTNLSEPSKSISEGKEQMIFLAEYAIDNTEFDINSSMDQRKLRDYIKTKVNHKKNGYADILVSVFCETLADIQAMRDVERYELKEPEPIDMKKVKMEMDREKRQQEKISAMLRIQFGSETVEGLKRELANTSDELEIKRLKAEIEIWGG